MADSVFDFKNKRSEWAQFLKKTRQFFDEHLYTEVTTSYLVTAGAFESTIDTLKVSFSSGSAELHSSPEIEMKFLLAEFPLAIFQICKSFRDDPESPIHSKEFTMLEFYKPETSSKDIEQETIALFKYLSETPISVLSYCVYDLIHQLTGINLELTPLLNDLTTAVRAKTQIHVSPDDTWADLFFKLMIDIVEPALPAKTFCLLKEYPSAVSPLSRPIPGTSKAERFEIYWNRIELCNGCTELSDEKLLRDRYEKESQERIKALKRPHPEPKKLFESANRISGFSGVAIGLERLFFAIESNDQTGYN